MTNNLKFFKVNALPSSLLYLGIKAKRLIE